MIKKYWWVAGAGLILLFVLIWPKNQDNTQKTDKTAVTVVKEDQYLPEDLPRAKSIDWQGLANIELPKLKMMKVKKQQIGTDREAKIKNILGINEKNGYIDKENNVVSFTEEIKSIEQLPKNGKWNIENLKDKLKKITEEVNGMNNLEIEWTGTRYQQILFPRWIDSSDEEAQSVEISGDYVIQGLRMTTYYGESIVGVFNREGKLIKFTLSLKPAIIAGEGEEELINVDELAKSPFNIFGIVHNAGVENIFKVNIAQANIVEIYSNKKNIVRPYYWLEGNTLTDEKPVKISMIVRADK